MFTINSNRESAGVDARDIKQQLDRILHHPLFHQSKRLPVFLRFVVQESLNRETDEPPPKERTIGIEVFGRLPDYDTNLDPVVRVTATELRKKLAQYYYEEGHEDEIRIELPSGSYLPKFRRTSFPPSATPLPLASEQLSSDVTLPALSEEPLAAEAVELAPAAPLSESAAASPYRTPKIWGVAAAAIIAFVLVGAYAQRALSDSSLGRFWRAFAGSSNEVLLVLPSIGSDGRKQVPVPSTSLSVAARLSMEDANILARVAGRLEKEGARYRLLSSTEATFEEMRSGPSLLIGALDNPWTMRQSKDLPFVFSITPDGHTGQITETRNQKRVWNLDIYTPHLNITHDYGIIARYHSTVTGQPVVLIAGISSQGTQASGELLTSSELFNTIPKKLINAANFEIVIETDAIDGHAGPPHILASETW
jgi:hypothetical protein